MADKSNAKTCPSCKTVMYYCSNGMYECRNSKNCPPRDKNDAREWRKTVYEAGDYPASTSMGFHYSESEVDKMLTAYAAAVTQERDGLRRALGEDAAGRPLSQLLSETADYLNGLGGGPMADCLKLKSQEFAAAEESQPK